VGGADYAEMFEWADKNPGKEDRRGFFVTFESGMIRKANSRDRYVLGVISSAPGVVGDSQGLGWQGMYMRDEWGCLIYEWADQPYETASYDAEAGKVKKETKTVRELQPRLNPRYNANMAYTPRPERPEWAAVGLMGKIIVRDDGTCRADGFCRPNDQGMATSSERGYYVIKRLGADKSLVLLDGTKWMV